MSITAASILTDLQVVHRERAHRLEVSGLLAKVTALKAYQQRRFSHTYDDLLQSARYGAASRFFLDELYGPADFAQRDVQFGRVVPALVRLFPFEIVETVATLAKLHALSETLDTAMALQLQDPVVDSARYAVAWARTGHRSDRDEQISLTIDVAARLDRLTRRTLLRNSLRLMRKPAQSAGLSELQAFLETGFDTFRAMGGANEFIDIVTSREHSLADAHALFSIDLDSPLKNPSILKARKLLPW